MRLCTYDEQTDRHGQDGMAGAFRAASTVKLPIRDVAGSAYAAFRGVSTCTFGGISHGAL